MSAQACQHVPKRGRLRAHDVPRDMPVAFSVAPTAADRVYCARNVGRGGRAEWTGCEGRRKLERQHGERAHQGAAAIGLPCGNPGRRIATGKPEARKAASPRRFDRLKVVASSSGAPGTEMWMRSTGRPTAWMAVSNRLGKAWWTSSLSTRPRVLQHADRVDDHVDLAVVQYACEILDRPIDYAGAQQIRLLQRRLLRWRVGAPNSKDAVAQTQKVQGNMMADQAIGAEHGDARCAAHDAPAMSGFATISQTIASMKPNPGTPKANHQRKAAIVLRQWFIPARRRSGEVSHAQLHPKHREPEQAGAA